MYSGLELTLLLLGSAVLGVVAFRMLHLPPMLGYLAVGILIGPHALGLADNNHTTHTLAEFGVVFLMFSIVLEFSLSQLNAMRRVVFGLGMAQVVLTIVATMVFGVLLAWQLPAHIKITWQASFALGGALAMSSTAIVVKMLTERLELESPHGRKIIGILLFQDLAVVPLLILIPSLGKPPGELANTLAWASFKAVIVLVLLLYVGQKIMRKWFTIVVKRRSQELFMLNLLRSPWARPGSPSAPACRWRWGRSWPACSFPKPSTSTRWRKTSSPSATCCWGCFSSRSACCSMWAWSSRTGGWC